MAARRKDIFGLREDGYLKGLNLGYSEILKIPFLGK